jgi:hypothetical protein
LSNDRIRPGMQGISYHILKQVVDVIKSLPNNLLSKNKVCLNINVSLLLKKTDSTIVNGNIILNIQ